MKKKILLGLGASLLMTSGLNAQIFGSLHDLGTSADDVGNIPDNSQICVYCHTPHGADSSFDGAPLWNKPATSTTFTMYGATATGTAGSTIAGTLTDATPTGASMACLTCHDGVSALNSVINAPGTGNYDPTGASNKIGKNRTMTDFVKAVGSAAFSESLTNDHPISIPYIYNGSPETSPASLRDPSTPIIGFENATTIADLLRTGADGIAKVQCSSCHDPHLGQATTFLRSINNNGSKLCLTCHAK